MKTLRLTAWLLAAMTASACRAAAPVEPTAEEPPAIGVTTWTDRTELFMEYPPLVAGAETRFALHLTDLSTFAPIRTGKVVVRFEGETIQRFEADGPSTPGIFGVDVKVPPARRYQVVVELHGSDLSDEHSVGVVTVHPDDAAALASVGGDDGEGATSFLKEQQWTLDFRTAVVDGRLRRSVVSVPATVEPRLGGSVEVRTAAAGRIAIDGGHAIGTRVDRGDALVELIALNDRIGEGPIRRLEVSAAETALRLAREDLARVERLTSAGAVPARRLAEARAAEETAVARLRIAEEQLRHLELSRTGEGSGSPDERVVVRAPMSGVIALSAATPGATVEAGALLFRIVALDRVHVVGAVPEQHIARVEDASAAEIEVPGLPAPLAATRRIAIGRVVDPASRSVPVTFELVNPPSAVAIGQAVGLRLLTAASSADVTVPLEAVVDDGGQSIVFVQAGGETFERRPVGVGGAREGGFVVITRGLAVGERVVTRGAHLVRLAALSPQTPGHGHVH
jgi:membrane fusion protein, heavy metal efflux system